MSGAYIDNERRKHLREGLKLFLVQNPGAPKAHIVNHFLKEGFCHRTIYNAIERQEEDPPIEECHRSGRPRKLSKHEVKRLKRGARNKVEVSQRKLSRRFDCDQRTIDRYLKREGPQYYKRERFPKYTDEQPEESPSICRRLLRYHIPAGISIVMMTKSIFHLITMKNLETPVIIPKTE